MISRDRLHYEIGAVDCLTDRMCFGRDEERRHYDRCWIGFPDSVCTEHRLHLRQVSKRVNIQSVHFQEALMAALM